MKRPILRSQRPCRTRGITLVSGVSDVSSPPRAGFCGERHHGGGLRGLPWHYVPVGALRVVIGKPGLDGHDRGAKVIARALGDAGIDVVYTGLHRSAAEIAQVAADEHADAVGLSILSGAHMTLIPAVLAELEARELGHLPVFAGGIIPKDDAAALTALGVRQIFAPGTPVHSVVDWVRDNVRPRAESH